MIKILLIENHTVIRKGICALLESLGESEVVGEANTEEEGLQMISAGKDPDIIILSINKPNSTGIAFMNRLKAINPGIRVLILSMIDHESHAAEAIKNGAYGFLQRDTSSEELLFAIKHIAAGHKYVSSDLMIRFIEQSAGKTFTPTGLKKLHLTNREMVILRLIADGFTNNEIANKLFTSRRTVEGHRQSLIEKTGSKNTAALIKFAVKAGIV